MNLKPQRVTSCNEDGRYRDYVDNANKRIQFRIVHSFFSSDTERICAKFIPFHNQQMNKYSVITYTFSFITSLNSNRNFVHLVEDCKFTLEGINSENREEERAPRNVTWKTCKLSCVQKRSTKPCYRPAAFRNLSYGLAGGSLNEHSDSLDAESLRRMRPFLVDCNSGSDRRDDCKT